MLADSGVMHSKIFLTINAVELRPGVLNEKFRAFEAYLRPTHRTSNRWALISIYWPTPERDCYADTF